MLAEGRAGNTPARAAHALAGPASATDEPPHDPDGSDSDVHAGAAARRRRARARGAGRRARQRPGQGTLRARGARPVHEQSACHSADGGGDVQPAGQLEQLPARQHDGADGAAEAGRGLLISGFRRTYGFCLHCQSRSTRRPGGVRDALQVKDGDAVLLAVRLSPGVGAARLIACTTCGRWPATSGGWCRSKTRNTVQFTISPTSSTRAFDSRR